MLTNNIITTLLLRRIFINQVFIYFIFFFNVIFFSKESIAKTFYQLETKLTRQATIKNWNQISKPDTNQAIEKQAVRSDTSKSRNQVVSKNNNKLTKPETSEPIKKDISQKPKKQATQIRTKESEKNKTDAVLTIVISKIDSLWNHIDSLNTKWKGELSSEFQSKLKEIFEEQNNIKNIMLEKFSILRFLIFIFGLLIIICLLSMLFFIIKIRKRGRKTFAIVNKLAAQQEEINSFIWQKLKQWIAPSIKDSESYTEASEGQFKDTDKYKNSDAKLITPIEPSKEITHEEIIKSPLEVFLEIYNKAIIDESYEVKFKEKYKLIGFSVENIAERTNNPNIKPIFVKKGAGEYWAINIDDNSPNKYLVVPRFGQTLQKDVFGVGAFEEVFKLVGYKRGNSYRHWKVEEPAIFELDNVTNKLLFKKHGILILL